MCQRNYKDEFLFSLNKKYEKVLLKLILKKYYLPCKLFTSKAIY